MPKFHTKYDSTRRVKMSNTKYPVSRTQNSPLHTEEQTYWWLVRKQDSKCQDLLQLQFLIGVCSMPPLPQSSADVCLVPHLPQSSADVCLVSHLPYLSADVCLVPHLPQSSADVCMLPHLPQSSPDVCLLIEIIQESSKPLNNEFRLN